MPPKSPRGPNPTLKRHQQLQLWSELVELAVTQNGYSIDFKVKVVSFLRERRYQDLVDLADGMARTVYPSREEHYLAHQFAALIRKADFLPLGIDTAQVALDSLRSSEWRCRWTNRKMRSARRRASGMDALIHYARDYIIRTLSRNRPRDESGFRDPSPDYGAIMRSCELTGGAVVGVHGNATNVWRKLCAESWSVTPDCFHLALAAVGSNPQLAEVFLPVRGQTVCWDVDAYASAFSDNVRLVEANLFSSVPKTAKTDRGIAVEPFLNLFVQTGINAELRRKLKLMGLDLSNQSVNQTLALHALEDRDDPYCTIDLSSASDTISTEVVRELLPPEWFDLLDAARSRVTHDAAGNVVATERFCSMGNGFCFPLQTLIFASLIYATQMVGGWSRDDLDFSVYGDDLIVRRSIFPEVIRTLKAFGFLPNSKKTFSEGPFRESCGVDSYLGQDVRPIELDTLDSVVKLYNLHNQSIRRKYATAYFASIREHIREFVLKNRSALFLLCPYDPTVSGHGSDRVDGAFWVPLDVAMTSRRATYHRNTGSWSFPLLVPAPVVDTVPATDSSGSRSAMLLVALTGGSSHTPFVLRYTSVYAVKRYYGPCTWLPYSGYNRERWPAL